jgi:hypothetical protein
MLDAYPTAADDAHADAVIAGTLCLMSCYVQHPVPLYAERVTNNLNRMAKSSALTPELRTICRRLAERWDVIQQSARQRIEGGEPAPEQRAFH